MDDPRYLIPRTIPLRYEFFPGWGWPEVKLVVAGVAIGLLAFANATWVLHCPAWRRLVVLVWRTALGYFAALPGFHETSMATQMAAWDQYRRRPSLWRYEWGRKDERPERSEWLSHTERKGTVN
jgi:hypothetical protein